MICAKEVEHLHGPMARAPRFLDLIQYDPTIVQAGLCHLGDGVVLVLRQAVENNPGDKEAEEELVGESANRCFRQEGDGVRSDAFGRELDDVLLDGFLGHRPRGGLLPAE